MFSENGRISDRQLMRLAVLDWFGKGALLLQELAREVPARALFLYLLAGFGLMLLYLGALRGIAEGRGGAGERRFAESSGGGSGRPGREAGRGGSLPETGFLAALLVFQFLNLVYLLRLFGEIGNRFVLPEVSGEALMLAAALAGLLSAAGGLESSARTASVLYPFLFYPLAALILLSAFTVRGEYLGPGIAVLDRSLLPAAGGVFLVFAGAGNLLLLAPRVEGKPWAAARKAALRTFVCLSALFLVLTGAFGAGGLKSMAWPVIALMSSAEIPGMFFQRWDVIFVGLLLVSMLQAAGLTVYCLTDCAGRLGKKGGKPFAALWAGAGFLCALWCGSYERALSLYLTVNGAAAAFLAVLAAVLRKRRGCL